MNTDQKKKWIFASILSVCIGAPSVARSSTPVRQQSVAAAEQKLQDPRTADYLLHLPGIAGYHWVDRTMIGGLRDGGYTGRLAVHDWPGDNAGLGALLARERNDRE